MNPPRIQLVLALQDFKDSIHNEPPLLKRHRLNKVIEAYDALLSEELNDIERQDIAKSKAAFEASYMGWK